LLIVVLLFGLEGSFPPELSKLKKGEIFSKPLALPPRKIGIELNQVRH